MERTLTELCAETKNYFKKNIVFGKFRVVDGKILEYDSELPLTYLQNGQYFRLCGSVFNDGVHQYPSELQDETEFEGSIWLMAIPSGFIKLATEIKEWRAKNESADSSALSPFTSESFGGYSYSKNANSDTTWVSIFRNKLNIWRKIR